MPQIKIDQLSFRYEKQMPSVLEGISLSVTAGERLAIIGKNGCGKSTLLRCFGNLLTPSSGTVTIDGKPLGSFGAQELAKIIAYVPQAIGRMQLPYTVADFVMLGRFPHQGFFALPSAHDRKIVADACALTDTETLMTRSMNTLSGGELQRVLLAAAVAQRSAVLLLDEPMSFLDPLHQTTMQQSLDRVHAEFGTTIITVTHDVNTAINRYSAICAIVSGKCFFSGSVAEFYSRAPVLLKEIYSIKFSEVTSPESQLRYFIPESIS